MAGANTLEFTEESFDSDVLNADVPVLVDFWAEWCGPCQLIAPVIDELATEYAGRIKVGKVDVDKCPNISARFGVSNIPTVIVFQGGRPVERIVGAKTKRDYKAVVDAKLGG